MTAGDPREGVPLAADSFALHMNVDGVPEDEGVGDLAVGGRVRLAQCGQRPIREDDAPPVRRARRVPLEEGNLPRGMPLLEQQTRIQPRRPAPEHPYPHPHSSEH